MVFLMLAFEAAAWAETIGVKAELLNSGKLPDYNAGDTIRVIGTVQLNSTGWSALNSGTKDSAKKNFSLVLNNGQTSIPADAMKYNGYLTSLNAVDVKTVGNSAFTACSISSVSLPRASAIGDSAFSTCDRLTGIYLPVVREVGRRAFSGCSKLTGISLPEAVKIGDFAFNGSSQLKNVSLPAVTELGTRSFYGGALISVSLPRARLIGSESFAVCAQMESAALPAAEVIQSRAFENCTALRELHLDNADPSTGTNAFNGVPDNLLIYTNRTRLKGTTYPKHHALVVSGASSKSSGGGCNTGIFVLLPVLAPFAVMTAAKRGRRSAPDA
jgi:hypothetical protein